MKLSKLLVSLLFVFVFLYYGIQTFAVENQYSENEATVDSILAQATKYISFDNEIALLYARQGKELLNKLNYKQGYQQYYYIRARIAYYDDDYINSKKWLDTVYTFLDPQKNTTELAQYYSLNSSVLALEGEFQKAIEYSLHSIRVREHLDDLNELALNTSFLGNLYLAQGDQVNAEKYYRKALAYNTKSINPVGYGFLLNNMGKLKNRQDSTEIAKEYFFDAYDLFVANGGLRGIATASKHIAQIAKQEKRFPQAVDMLQEAEEIYMKLDEKYGLASILIELSSCYHEWGDYNLAVDYGEQAFELANQIESEPLVANSHLAISKGYQGKGEFKKALEEYRAYAEINTKLLSWENNKKINDLEHQAEMLEKEKNIEILNQKSSIQSLRFLILVLVAGVLLIASVLIFYSQRLRNRNLKQKHEILQERNRVVEVENKLNEQQNQMLENDLELKNKELASKALALLQLNETLHDIGEKINDSNKQKFDPKLKNSIIHEIHQATHNNIWEEFDVAFKQVHNSFYESLLEKCPNLSSTEIKIAALLRLNLSTKEIASITYKSDSAIKIARHRIRTKLGLESNDNLISYLLKL